MAQTASSSSTARSKPSVNAIIPLTLLRTIRALDRTRQIDLEDYSSETAPRRLGTSPSVAAQIERFEKLAKQGTGADGEEVAQLFRLVGRRSDAELAFNQAGRAAAEEILRRTSGAKRFVEGAGRVVGRMRFDRGRAKRLADRLLSISLTFDERAGIQAVANGPLSTPEPDGLWCGFCGAALGELLGKCTQFEGAMQHDRCRGRGDEVCSWSSEGGSGS